MGRSLNLSFHLSFIITKVSAMGRASNVLKRRKTAEAAVTLLFDHPDNVYAIHYSCESFFDIKDGRSPRITSIAVVNMKDKQGESFSIHQIAERRQIVPTDIKSNYDKLEQEFLSEFYDFVKRNTGVKWVHWNMRNIQYGFPAIAHRLKVLGGHPVDIHGSTLYDLADLLQTIYGPNYVPHPRMERLVDKNQITKTNFLSGADEALAFEEERYVALHQSTLRKAEMIVSITERQWKGILKTDATWRERYKLNLVAVTDLFTDHWLFKTIGFLSIVVGLVTGIIFLVGLF